MKKGFTILELLVASLLLGMLVTILTMIFNQSSVAWRTGVAGVADLDRARSYIAQVREETDNAYVWDDKVYRLTGLWDKTGNLRTRAWSIVQTDTADDAALVKNKITSSNDTLSQDSLVIQNLDAGNPNGSGNATSYSVNVMSAGPNRKFGDYDDIWSAPDEFDL